MGILSLSDIKSGDIQQILTAAKRVPAVTSGGTCST